MVIGRYNRCQMGKASLHSSWGGFKNCEPIFPVSARQICRSSRNLPIVTWFQSWMFPFICANLQGKKQNRRFLSWNSFTYLLPHECFHHFLDPISSKLHHRNQYRLVYLKQQGRYRGKKNEIVWIIKILQPKNHQEKEQLATIRGKITTSDTATMSWKCLETGTFVSIPHPNSAILWAS